MHIARMDRSVGLAEAGHGGCGGPVRARVSARRRASGSRCGPAMSRTRSAASVMGIPAAVTNSGRAEDPRTTGTAWVAVRNRDLAITGVLADQAPLAAQRRAVVQASPELQERGRTKFAAVTDAVADALRDRGTAESEATLLAQVGVAIFRTAFERWADQPDDVGLPARIREAAAELAASLGEVDFAAVPPPVTR